jgi:hypothetical protein
MHRWVADVVRCVLLARREKHAQVGCGHCDVHAPGAQGKALGCEFALTVSHTHTNTQRCDTGARRS